MGVVNVPDPVEAYNRRVKAEGWKGVCDRTLAFESRELAAALGVWKDKAGAREMPARKDLDLRSVKSFIRNLLILECDRQPGGNIRYLVRLFGTGLVETMGGEATGRYMDQIVHPTRLSRWVLGYETVLAERKPLRFVSWFEMQAISYLKAESLMAPLSDDGKTVTGIFVLGTFSSPHAAAA
jgi:hypothetical protein